MDELIPAVARLQASAENPHADGDGNACTGVGAVRGLYGGAQLFGQLLAVVKMDVTRTLLNVRIQTQEEAALAAQAIEQQGEHLSNVTYTHPNEDGSVATETDPSTVAAEVPRVGRNDPCPCGSGEKYKNCHGKLA